MDLVKDLYGNGKLYRLSMDPSGIDISGETQVLRINSDKITGNLNIDGNVEINGNNNFVVTNTGNVGIGTNTPGTTLHIFDSISQHSPAPDRADINQLRIDSLGYNTGLAFKFKGLWGTNPSWKEYDFDQARISTTGVHFDSKLHFDTAYHDTTISSDNKARLATRMTIDSDGNVGIGTTSPSEKLEVDGRLKVPQNQLQDGTNIGGVIPSGGIIMWHGSAVPDGWTLCDGYDGTPDLTNRFIRGGTTSQVNQTGGSDTKTISTSNMPTHNHSAGSNSTGSHTHGIHNGGGVLFYNHHGGGPYLPIKHPVGGNWWPSRQSWGSHSHGMNSAGGHSHTITVNNNGSGTAFDIKPTYYVLAFIMKL